MSHEPECQTAITVVVNGTMSPNVTPQWGGTCHCDIIKTAYKRGREDAAKDTGAYVISNLDSQLETADFLDGLWNAARGGEQG